MNPFARFPFLRYTLPLMVGIAFGSAINIPLLIALTGLASTSAALLLVSYVKYFRAQYGWRYFFAVNFQLFWICFGISLVVWKDMRNADDFSHEVNAQELVLIKLKEPPVKKKKSFKALAEVVATYDGVSFLPAKGNVMLYFLNDSTEVTGCYCGDLLLIPKIDQPIPGPKNPGEFDFSSYLAFQQIYRQAFLKPGFWSKVAQGDRKEWLRSVFLSRDWLLEKLNRFIPGDIERGVAGALLFGFKDNLDRDVIDAYARTGTLHVLAVSGMHVAILYVVVSLLFKPLQKTKAGAWLVAVFTIFIIWFYSLISGMSPSIVRASVMFTIIVLGKVLRDDISIYNNLFTSAGLILCYNPYFLFDAGFQLSYLAVFGIVYFQPKIASWIMFKSWLAQQIWNLVTVSLAAQIATVPISLFYFSQFPNLFLISNLIIIPVTTLIMYLGMLLLVVSGWHWFAAILGWLITKLILFADTLIIQIQALPYAVTEGLYVTKTDTIFWYLFILLVCVYFVQASKIYARLAFMLFCMMFLKNGITRLNQSHQQTIVLNAIKEGFCVNIIEGKKNYLIADSGVTTPQNIKAHFKGFWNSRHASEPIILDKNSSFHTTSFIYTPDYLITAAHTILFAGAHTQFHQTQKISADHLLICRGFKGSFNDLHEGVNFKSLICDFSLSPRLRKQLAKETPSLGIGVHDMISKGAVILE